MACIHSSSSEQRRRLLPDTKPIILNRTNDQWREELHQKIPEVLGSLIVPPPSSAIDGPGDAFAALIEHTLLKPDATPDQVELLCSEAIKYGFKACCVNGRNIKQVARRLKGSGVLTCCVVGFPLGTVKPSVKAFEAREAVADGAQEVDMVMDITALKEKDYVTVFNDIRGVVEACGDASVKVILETVFLTTEEKVAAAYVAAETGAMFVKTCTGFNGGGANADDIGLLHKTVRHRYGVKVKASGGIREFEKSMEMVRAGALRIGTSAGAAMMGKNDAMQYNY